MNNKTLLKYNIGTNVEAFSTTRISPFSFSEEELVGMGNYAAFNVTDYCGDEPQRVEKNRQWLCREIHINDKQLWLPRQTHSCNVLCIDDGFLKQSDKEKNHLLQDTDALITNIPQQCIGVSTADCVPILLYDAQNRAVAAIHAGWRGTVKHIARHVFYLMKSHYGTKATDCTAIIGPSISVTAFEVGDEVVEEFTSNGFSENIISRQIGSKKSKAHIDLWAANAYTLEECGFDLQQIHIAGICTYSHYDTFFSARRLSINSGRIFTGICLKE